MNAYEYDLLDVTERCERRVSDHDRMTLYQLEEYGMKQSFDKKGFYYRKEDNNYEKRRH